MSEYLESFIKKNKPQFQKYKKYIEANDWTSYKASNEEDFKKQKEIVNLKSEEYKLQNDLVQYILNRVSVLVKKTTGDHNNPKFKKFIKYCLDIVNYHDSRIDGYLYSIDITQIENQEVRSDEIKLTKDCHSGANKIEEIVTNLNIREDQATEGIRWLDEQKATVAMHETLVRIYPEIQVKLDAMGVDFNSSPPPTIHILNEDPPIYNPDKNYWEQDKEVIQYYFWEYQKISRGIEIDGYYIDGWLYFHFNYFVANIPQKIIVNGVEENKDDVRVPELRDNEMMINNYSIKSKKDGKMSLIAATRRAAKTTMNSSRLHRALVLNKRQVLCAGGSEQDLGHIHSNLNISQPNIHPAFKLYFLSPTTDGRGKAYGIKNKNNKSEITSQLYVINLEGGSTKKKKESLAGFTPDEFILDEIYKFPFKEQLDALEPALWGTGVLRCIPLLTGTGGDEDLAADGIRMLNHPEESKVCLMDWGIYNHVPPELVTWKQKKFGLFLPAQMSIRNEKIRSNMADYLGIESETLSKVPLWVTDWEKAKNNELKDRQSKLGNKKEYTRHLAYFPLDPEEIFLSGKESPFSNVIDIARRHRDYLLETGKWDNRKRIWRDSEGEIQIDISKDEFIPYPFLGANQDAPYNIIEPPDNKVNPMYYYLASGDFYKQEQSSSTDSVGTIFIIKFPIAGDRSAGKVVASYAARPNRYKDFNEKALLLLELYNARFLPENEDLGVFQTFLEQKRLEEVYLEKHIDFSGVLQYSDGGARKWGWTPKQSKRKLMGMFVNYLEQDVEIENEAGDLVTVKRVQTIDDIHLLSEIISFTENGNFDRISGILGAIGLMHFLDKNYIYPKIKFKRKEGQEEPQKITHSVAQYFRPATNKKSFFRSR